MSLDHPVHPSTVHFPIAFLSLSYGLDALHPILPSLPSAIKDFLPAATELSRISYYSLGLGLLTALPSIASGLAQGSKLIQNQGIYEKDNKTIRPKVKVLAAHAIANDVVVAASAYSWWCRRQASSVKMLASGLNPVAYEPVGWQVGLSVAMLAFLLFAANLGGSLVYDYGVGLGMGKKVIKKNE